MNLSLERTTVVHLKDLLSEAKLWKCIRPRTATSPNASPISAYRPARAFSSNSRGEHERHESRRSSVAFADRTDGQCEPADDHGESAERNHGAEPVPFRIGERQHFQEPAKQNHANEKRPGGKSPPGRLAMLKRQAAKYQRDSVKHLVADGRLENRQAVGQIIARETRAGQVYPSSRGRRKRRVRRRSRQARLPMAIQRRESEDI